MAGAGPMINENLAYPCVQIDHLSNASQVDIF